MMWLDYVSKIVSIVVPPSSVYIATKAYTLNKREAERKRKAEQNEKDADFSPLPPRRRRRKKRPNR